MYQIKEADAAQALSREPLLTRTYAQTIGPGNARVHIVESLDPACETCASFYPFVKRMPGFGYDQLSELVNDALAKAY